MGEEGYSKGTPMGDFSSRVRPCYLGESLSTRAFDADTSWASVVAATTEEVVGGKSSGGGEEGAPDWRPPDAPAEPLGVDVLITVWGTSSRLPPAPPSC